MMISHFCLVCFTFSFSYLALPFHLVYVLKFLHLIFLMLFFKSLSSVAELSYTYIYINMYNIYILENLWIFAWLKYYDIFILLVWLSLTRMLDF